MLKLKLLSHRQALLLLKLEHLNALKVFLFDRGQILHDRVANIVVYRERHISNLRAFLPQPILLQLII